MKTETMEELLGSYPFFTGLSADAVRLMAGCASNMHFSADDYIFNEGEDASRFYVIRHGRVALEIHSPARGPLLIDSMDDGEARVVVARPALQVFLRCPGGDAGQRDRARRRLPTRQGRGRSGARLPAAEARHRRDVPAPAVHTGPAARHLRALTNPRVNGWPGPTCGNRPSTYGRCTTARSGIVDSLFSALRRTLELTGALVQRTPPTVVGPLPPDQAASELLAYLRRCGYLGAADLD